MNMYTRSTACTQVRGRWRRAITETNGLLKKWTGQKLRQDRRLDPLIAGLTSLLFVMRAVPWRTSKPSQLKRAIPKTARIIFIKRITCATRIIFFSPDFFPITAGQKTNRAKINERGFEINNANLRVLFARNISGFSSKLKGNGSEFGDPNSFALPSRRRE